MNLLNNTLITRVLVATADGTGTQSSDILDMQGYEGVLFIWKLDDVDDTAVLTLQAQQDELNAAGGMATLTGTATFTAGATDADDDCLVLDVYRPTKRYVRAQGVIATANATTAAIIAIQYGARKSPVTQSSTVVDSQSIYGAAEA